MNLYRVMFMGACALTWGNGAIGQASSPPKPPPAPVEVPDLRKVNPVIFCGNCDQPFDTSTHKAVLEGLVSNKYIGELRKALYVQDSYHQFESKAHFDNCAFSDSIEYIDGLLAEVDGHVRAAQTSKDSGDSTAAEASLLKAFFALGQALHGVAPACRHRADIGRTIS